MKTVSKFKNYMSNTTT
uniref:Uncharacterized protein n=1 Tax=Rhizophora mucronata TaxID=61149 RepID=A0A2P2IIH3_RHIMU